MRRWVFAAAGAALAVIFMCWRLWTPIDGARRVFAGDVGAPVGVALLVAFTLGVFVWLVARGAPAAAAALGAGVALVALPPAGGRLAALGGAVALLPWALALVERAARAAGPRVAPLAALAPLAAWLVMARGGAGWLGLLVPRLPGGVLYAGAATLVAAACAPLLRRDARTLAGAAVALLGLAAGHAGVALLALVALAADGVAAIAEGDARVARALTVAGVLAAAAFGCAVTLTLRSKATPLHDALVIAFFAWSASLWALAALAAAEARWRRLLLAAVAVIAWSDAWFAAAPRLDALFARPAPGQR
jgi:hypothetical protein